jgi:hypothetical protein
MKQQFVTDTQFYRRQKKLHRSLIGKYLRTSCFYEKKEEAVFVDTIF